MNVQIIFKSDVTPPVAPAVGTIIIMKGGGCYQVIPNHVKFGAVAILQTDNGEESKPFRITEMRKLTR